MSLWTISHGPTGNPIIRTHRAIDALRPALAYALTAREWRQLTRIIGPDRTGATVPPDHARRLATVLHRFASARHTPGGYTDLATELADCAMRAHQAGEPWTWTSTSPQHTYGT